MRLFVSVDLPEELAAGVEAVQDRLGDAGGLRLTDPTQAHVTLQFLGEAAPERVESVERALREAVEGGSVGPFEATVGGLGVFPSRDYISVVWLGFENGGEQLTRLHEAVEPAMVELGFEADDHSFTPHVTVARLDHVGGKARVQRVLDEGVGTVGSWRVEAVHLTESELTDGGPAYETVASLPLD